MTLVLRTAARSDVGLVRARNEDSGYAGPDLLVVADGMGGHAAGELASATAVATLAELETEGMADEDAVARLAAAVEEASERIADVVAADPQLAGMGTTVTALGWLGAFARVALVHVGDSRAYLLRDGELTQLTRDHTYVQSLVDAGRITPAEAAVHPRRALVMRAIDGVHPAEPDISVREARAHDRFLICSDGLSGVVSHQQLQRLLGLTDPAAAVTALVDAALAGGAPDNVTCVLADVIENDDTAVPAARPVVVGAAGELRVREQLPGLSFPVDAEPDPGAEPDATAAHATVVRVNTAPDTRLEGPAALARVYAEERGARRHGSWRLWIGVAITVVLLLVAAFLAFGAWARGQWFVGESDGRVAVFNGVPGGIGPFTLHRVEELSDLRIDQLPTFEADQVRATVYASTQAAADETLARLRVRAEQCVTAPTTAGCPGAAT